jgi:hypothetical protein
MKVKKIYSNRYTGSLPRGCRVCMKGAKLVLFVTGICGRSCYYCPLSEKRGGKDQSWANEAPVYSPRDIIREAERMQAMGAGITGGDPALRMDRTLNYISLLKEHFDDFHIHMYTASALGKKKLKSLREAGLDELRYHVDDGERIWKSVERSISLGITTGVEIPAIPSEERWISGVAEKLTAVGGDFLILNELEFSDTNAEALRRRKYELKSETSYAVKGSEETALKILGRYELNIHFCSSQYKDSVQLRKRLIRTARNIAKDFEEVNEDGLLMKGVIRLENPTERELMRLRDKLIRAYDIPENLIEIDREKMRLETTMEIAEGLSEVYKKKNLSYFLVEEYPTADRIETDVIPL